MSRRRCSRTAFRLREPTSKSFSPRRRRHTHTRFCRLGFRRRRQDCLLRVRPSHTHVHRSISSGAFVRVYMRARRHRRKWTRDACVHGFPPRDDLMSGVPDRRTRAIRSRLQFFVQRFPNKRLFTGRARRTEKKKKKNRLSL